MKINSKNSETSNLHYIDWIGVNKKIFGSFRVGPKNTWLQMGQFTLASEHIWSTFPMTISFTMQKRSDWSPNVYNSSANCATHTTGEWTEVLVQIQSLPKIQSLPQ